LLTKCRFEKLKVFEKRTAPVVLFVAVTKMVPETIPELIEMVPEIVTVTL